MIAAYVRVSTNRQKDDSQRHEIQKWLNANGINPEQVEWYSDTVTGKTMVRPEFQRLQRDIFSGKVKQVVLWKLDRLSRRLKDGIVTLADWAEKDVKIIVVTQQIEFSGPSARLLQPSCWDWRKSNSNSAVNAKRVASPSPRKRACTRVASRVRKRRSRTG